jgi:DNA helicase II / ATP-dependent DNA helicase PcrA
MLQARAKAREERERVGGDADGLLTRLKLYMVQEHGIAFVEMSPEQMEGSDAEVDEDHVLKYRRTLTDDERLALFAHELGHVVLHRRLMDPNVPLDPIVASAYSDAGAAAIARYSPRVREEAEAKAFALEFQCPSTKALAMWREDERVTIAMVAKAFGGDVGIARIQLANALHDLATGAERAQDDARRAPEVQFTDEQIDAARHTGSPALVDAGPGTGKTSTLIRRVEFALEERKAAPNQVLALTFSNEAAREMFERVTAKFGVDVAHEMTIATFHGFGMELLHWHGAKMGLPLDFRLMDEDAQVELVSELLGRVECPTLDPLANPAAVANQVVKYINHLKHRQIGPDELAAAMARWTPAGRDDPAAGAELLALYREYESVKREQKSVDFADLVLMPLQLLESEPELREKYRTKYPWVLVDEFQDMTRATSALLRALCGAANPPWVVGDARQAIYQFMGAAPENVSLFASDFQGSKTYALSENHRSSAPIVEAANELASLFPEVEADASARERWRSIGDAQPLVDRPVAIAAATSDYAEAHGIVDQIAAWQEKGVEAGDIAVLARRHIDVRSVVLALTDRGIKAESAGLLTAEGAAGDLAVVLTLASDKPAVSIPRLAMALGRNRYSRDEINATVAYLLEVERKTKRSQEGDGDGEDATAGSEAAVEITVPAEARRELLEEIATAREHAERERYRADGFECLMTLLFDGSRYLRRVLAADDSALRSMTLVEIVSTLSLAAAYHVTHPSGKGSGRRHRHRYAFAARLRLRLTETGVPIPIAPMPRRDAVRVMTCHASKGLEFPCVIVAGQTVPQIRESWAWIPPACRPRSNEDVDQANALLFVGVTRAKHAVLVSYPEKATESERSRAKVVVPLLEAWGAKFRRLRMRWEARGGAADRAEATGVWGQPREGTPEFFKPGVLGEDVCAIRVYLEDVLGLRFAEAALALYPVFFGAVRKVLREVSKRAIEIGPVSASDAEALLDEKFGETVYGDHPHFPLYQGAALGIVKRFANAFRPEPGTTYVDPQLDVTPSGAGTPVRLDLIARFREPGGQEVAMGFRPESRREQLNKKDVLVWSKVGAGRIPYVLVWQSHPNLSPRMFSGLDGEIHQIGWHARSGGMEGEVGEMAARHAALVDGDYGHDVDAYECDRRCRMRVTCPYWLGALP